MKWDDKQIKRAAKIYAAADKTKGPVIRLLDEAVHWLIILIILIGNLVLWGFLVLVGGLLSIGWFYLLVAFLGLGFGMMVDLPLKDVERIDKKKYLVTQIVLPLLALLNIYFVYGLRNALVVFLKIQTYFDPLVGGLIYGVALVTPHYVRLIRR